MSVATTRAPAAPWPGPSLSHLSPCRGRSPCRRRADTQRPAGQFLALPPRDVDAAMDADHKVTEDDASCYPGQWFPGEATCDQRSEKRSIAGRARQELVGLLFWCHEPGPAEEGGERRVIEFCPARRRVGAGSGYGSRRGRGPGSRRFESIESSDLVELVDLVQLVDFVQLVEPDHSGRGRLEAAGARDRTQRRFSAKSTWSQAHPACMQAPRAMATSRVPTPWCRADEETITSWSQACEPPSQRTFTNPTSRRASSLAVTHPRLWRSRCPVGLRGGVVCSAGVA